jgi:hypothetical protein
MARAAAVLLAAALLCLGCVTVQAAAAGAAGVLMEGYPSPEAAASISSFETGTLGLMHKREHKKHKQVASQKHHDYYPEHRQTIQETLAQFERCLKRAAALLDSNDREGTLPAAGEAFVGCINEYLDICIDVPSLDQLVAGIGES